jgi:hypothetical protein
MLTDALPQIAKGIDLALRSPEFKMKMGRRRRFGASHQGYGLASNYMFSRGDQYGAAKTINRAPSTIVC